MLSFHFFWLYTTISRICERFRDGQYTDWSVSCLLFFYSLCPRALESAPVHLRRGHVKSSRVAAANTLAFIAPEL